MRFWKSPAAREIERAARNATREANDAQTRADAEKARQERWLAQLALVRNRVGAAKREGRRFVLISPEYEYDQDWLVAAVVIVADEICADAVTSVPPSRYAGSLMSMIIALRSQPEATSMTA